MQTDIVEALEAEAKQLIHTLDRHALAHLLFDGVIAADAYAQFLIQTYHSVRWSSPLLELAGKRMEARPKMEVLGQLLMDKSQEEGGHERWALQDLEILGWQEQDVVQTEPCRAVSAYVEWNRFAIEDCSPLALLGTSYVLEYLGMHRAGVAASNLVQRAAIPRVAEAVRFLREHGEADVDHLLYLQEMLHVHLRAEDTEAVALSGKTTRLFYVGMMDELARSDFSADGGSTPSRSA